MTYKGYTGSVEISREDNLIFGKIECINDLVSYQAETPIELQAAFEEAVDDYLETCNEIGRTPDKEMSGTFQVRIGSELHKKVYLESVKLGTSLNDVIKIVARDFFNKEQEIHYHNHLHQTTSAVDQQVIDVPSWEQPNNVYQLKAKEARH